MKKIISWVLIGISAIMLAFYVTESAYLSAFLALLSGLVILPPLVSLIEKRISKKLNFWVLPAIWFLLIVLTFPASPQALKDKMEARRLKQEKKNAEKRTAGEKAKKEPEAQAKKEVETKAKEQPQTKNETSEPQKMDTYNENGKKLGTKDKPKPQPEFGGVVLDKSQFGEKWPLAVDWGEVTCENMGIFFYSNGNKYAVNGTSKSSVGKNGVKEIDEIWIDDPEYKNIKNMKGTKISIGPIISSGLELCSK